MIKITSTDCGEDAKKIWAEIKKEIEKSVINEIEVEHEVTNIYDGTGRLVEKMYTGVVEVKLRYLMNK